MAYAALSSLIYTLKQLLKPNQPFVCLSSTQHHVRSLYQNLSVLQVFLDDTTKETKDIETLKFIEKRIRDVIYKAEDKVDSSLRNIILADCGEKREGAAKFFEEELLKVVKDVDSPRKEVMAVECNKHGSKSAELATTPSSPEKSIIEENTIVGMEDDFNIIFDRLSSQTDELTVIPIFGMGGIGKTTLAKKVYDDAYIRSRFDKHAWVTLSEDYNQKQMLLEIASSITGINQEMSDDQLMEIVYRGLKGRRFLIVIDDIWSTEAWEQMQRIFPNDDNRSRILLTTRLKYIADYVSCPDFPPHSKSFLSPEDSWNLFTEKLFKKDQCPPLLVEIGKHIVQQCQGLPLSIVVVAGLLGKILDGSKLPDSFSILEDLETLHIETQENIDPMIISRDISLPNLNKLKLFGTRIPWEVVNLLANLPNLEVLNGNRAFVGKDWKVDEDVVFHKLKYLHLYRCRDLERWELAAGSDNFPMLEQLKLYLLPELEEIPESIGEIMTIKSIRIVDCGSGVNTSARKIQQEQESLGNYELQLQIFPIVVV